MRFTYCKDCGTLLTETLIGDEGLVPYCEVCHKPHFDYAPVCILTMVINEDNEVALTETKLRVQRSLSVCGRLL